MKKYRLEDKPSSGPQSEDLAKPDTPINPWMWYVDDLESDDEKDMSISEQTIEEEYTSYATSVSRRSTTVNPIKFWEVYLIIMRQNLAILTMLLLG